jgi:hypothetical protein
MMTQPITDTPHLLPLPYTEDILSYNIQDSANPSEAIACPSTIHCTSPEGLKIEKSCNGFGIFATKYFPKYSCLFQSKYVHVRDEHVKMKLIVDQCDIFELDSLTHSATTGNGTRMLITFEAMMNHNCSANSYIVEEIVDGKKTGSYKFYALRDIQPNEEVTENYCLVVYDTTRT